MARPSRSLRRMGIVVLSTGAILLLTACGTTPRGITQTCTCTTAADGTQQCQCPVLLPGDIDYDGDIDAGDIIGGLFTSISGQYIQRVIFQALNVSTASSLGT